MSESTTPSSPSVEDQAPTAEHDTLVTVATLTFFSIVLAWLFRAIIIGQSIGATDLDSHIEIIRQLAVRISHGELIFYDHGWFGGWPAFQFYGFVAHVLTALVALALSVVSEHPVTLACYAMIYAALILLPFSVYMAASSVATLWPTRQATRGFLLAVFAGTLSIWFLHHSLPKFGIGAATVLNFGLYTQIFAWHLLLLNLSFLASLVRTTDSTRYALFLAIGFAALIATHPPSALVFSCFAFTGFIYFSNVRLPLSAACTVAVGLVAFWIVPFVLLMPDYTLAGTSQANHHLIELYTGQASTLSTRPLTDTLWPFALDIFPPILLLSILAWTMLRDSTRQSSIMPFLLTIPLLGGLLTYLAVSDNVPINLPYQRLKGLLVLMSLPLLAAVLFELCRFSRSRIIVPALLLIVTATAAANKLVQPNRLLALFSKGGVHQVAADSPEQQLLNYLAAQPEKGRVFFEWFKGAGFPANNQRYLESALLRRTGFETANGLFIQSAPAYLFSTMAAIELGATTIAGYFAADGRLRLARTKDLRLLERPKPSTNPVLNIQRMMDSGVSHLVAGTSTFKDKLDTYGVPRLVDIGPYSVYQLTRFQAAVYPAEELIGYIDTTGELPLVMIAYYLDRKNLTGQPVRLIELRQNAPVPDEITRIVVNGDYSADPKTLGFNEPLKNKTVLSINFSASRFAESSAKQSGSVPDYQLINRYLDRELANQRAFFANRQLTPVASKPVLRWQTGEQQFSVSALQPARLVQIKYNYFPYWQPDNGTFYRGGNGHIYHLPVAENTTATFSLSHYKPAVAGLVISLASILVLVYWFARYRRGDRKKLFRQKPP